MRIRLTRGMDGRVNKKGKCLKTDIFLFLSIQTEKTASGIRTDRLIDSIIERRAVMRLKQSDFSAKLYELEKEYRRLLDQLGAFRDDNLDMIRKTRERLEEEYRSYSWNLRQDICKSRSPAVRELAKVQYDHNRQMEALSEKLPEYFHSESSRDGEEEAEAAALYAEYTIDFAVCSIRGALEAVLEAAELQMEQEENDER